MCGRTGMSWRRRSTPGSRTEPRGGDDRVCLRRGEGLRSFQGGRETSKTASWQPAKSRIRLLLKESDIPVAVNPKLADGPSNNPQCGFWDSQFSAAQVKSVEQPCPCSSGATLHKNVRRIKSQMRCTAFAICRDDDRGPLVEPADKVEQELTASLSERQITELIEDDEVHAGQVIGKPALSRVASLGLKPVDEIDHVVEPASGAG